MSDTTPPVPPEPTPPNSGYTAQPSGANAYGAQPDAANPYGAQPGAANPYGAPTGAQAKAPVLSIISLIAGVVGFFGAWIVIIPIIGSILGLFIPAAAVILGILGKKKEPQASKGLWLTGIILGAVSLAIAVIALVFWIIAIATSGASGMYDTTF